MTRLLALALVVLCAGCGASADEDRRREIENCEFEILWADERIRDDTDRLAILKGRGGDAWVDEITATTRESLQHALTYRLTMQRRLKELTQGQTSAASDR